MKKKYKVVNIPEEPTRHHLGNFGLVLIEEDLPQEICEAGFKAGLPYFAEAENAAEVPFISAPVSETALVEEKEEKRITKK